MRVWELRDHGDKSDYDYRRMGMRENPEKEAYECGFEDGYEKAMEEMGHHSDYRSNYRSSYRMSERRGGR
jgi:hypothetical protein